MLHFQVFTSAEPPLFTISTVRSLPPFGPFHSPYSSHYPFSRPPLFRSFLSLSLSFSFPSHPTLPPTLYLSLPFFRRDVSLVIARPRLPPLVDVHGARRLSRGRVFTSTPWMFPSLAFIARSSSSPEDLFVLRGLRISSRHNGRLTDTRLLCLSLLDVETGWERGRKRVARSRVYGHTSEIAEVEESAFLVPLASTGNMAAPVAQLEQACARARRLQYH